MCAVCFLPFGLMAAFFAWQTHQAIEAEDLTAARRAARAARVWTIVAAATGLVIDGVLLATFLLLGAFGRS